MSSSTGTSSLRILIANRGEISLRLQDAITSLGHIPLGIHTASEDAAHLRFLPAAQRLVIPGHGARAYLDIPALISVAKVAGADAVVPGYGFLSESPAFAQAVLDAGMIWVGPRPESLALFGDKHAAKAFAAGVGVPVLHATSADASLDEIRAFAGSLAPGTKVLLKALEGGGGRGIRVVQDMAALEAEYNSCKREAAAAFPSDKVFAEPFLPDARHVEVQIVGDGRGGVVDVGERECSLQRRHQKIIELCPSPTLVHLPALRARILAAARKLAAEGKLLSLATFEFLVTIEPSAPDGGHFYFLECNPRLQVEHTVTEEAYRVDLARAQLLIALGQSLGDVLPPIPSVPHRAALQLRVNAEKFLQDGTAAGTTGTLSVFAPPTGRDVRVDTAAHAPLVTGPYVQSLDFDSLLAKIIVVAPDYAGTVYRARGALNQLQIGGVGTNKALLLALIEDPRVIANEGISTRFVEQNAAQLFQHVQSLEAAWAEEDKAHSHAHAPGIGLAAVEGQDLPPLSSGQAYVKCHLPGRLVTFSLKEGGSVKKGDEVAILESMKMEHTVRSEVSGTVVKTYAKTGDNMQEGEALAVIQVNTGADGDDGEVAQAEEVDLEFKSPALLELEEVRAQSKDDHRVRAKATQRRRDRGYRTAQENLADLVDGGTFLEYGDLVLAAQRTRLKGDALLATRNDGVIVGWARIRGGRAAVVMYDYGVLAGTQGYFHHLKLDRIFSSVLENPAPVVLYAEGGGGRPGDVDLENTKVAGLHGPSFFLLAQINARGIPIIGVANGNLFAGNAALLGTSDLVIATLNKGTSLGMGGPAMIEGGGLGVVAPEDVGPVPESHMKNGNVDIVVQDEAAATAVAKQLVDFFTPRRLPPISLAVDGEFYTRDPRLLRHAIPQDRKRAYDMHNILALLSDDDTPFFEIGDFWGPSIITGFIRVQGRLLGVVASNVLSPLGGAIDAASARKAIRFTNFLTKTKVAHLLALCDTPGFMVGPLAEKEGGMRAFAEYFAASAGFVDSGGRIFGIAVRKAYGLGAQAVLGGSTIVPFNSVAWPTGEFAGMGIEGAVKLGMKKELDAIADLDERAKQEQTFIDAMYTKGRAINMAQKTEIDSVIDPAESRGWLVRCLDSVEERSGFEGKSRRVARL